MYTPSGHLVHEPTMKVGDLVICEDRVWRVGLVNFTRARLDPITPDVTKSRQSWESIDIGPSALVESGEGYEFDEADNYRLIRLLDIAEYEAICEEEARIIAENKRIDAAERERIASFINTPVSLLEFEEETDMSATAEAPLPTATKPSVAAGLKEKNRQRIADLAAKKAAAKTASESNMKPKAVRKEATPKVAKECKCGCGGETYAMFVPGHDARMKGWFIAIEKGDAKKEDLMTPEVIAQYKWVASGLTGKAGKGQQPTTNYKGEAHGGYVDEAQRERMAAKAEAAAATKAEATKAAPAAVAGTTGKPLTGAAAVARAKALAAAKAKTAAAK